MSIKKLKNETCRVTYSLNIKMELRVMPCVPLLQAPVNLKWTAKKRNFTVNVLFFYCPCSLTELNCFTLASIVRLKILRKMSPAGFFFGAFVPGCHLPERALL